MQSNSRDKKFEIDLTISNAKNLSLEVLSGGDSALQEAHRAAVSCVINLIESRYVQTRIDGQPVTIDNPTVTKWHDDTSRELDPHLHTHSPTLASGDEEC